MMKRNNLIKKIKKDIYQSTPDVYSKIKLDQIKIEPYQENKIKERKTKLSFKYAFSSLMTLVLVFVIVVLLIKPEGEIIIDPVYNYSPLDSSEEVYAVSSVVAANLYLATFTNGDTLALSNSNNEMLINSGYSNLNKILNSIESLINNKEKSSVKQLNSDDDNYQFLLEINSMDLMMFENTYYLYYNIINEIDLSPIKYDGPGNGSWKTKEEDEDRVDEAENDDEEEDDDKEDYFEEREDIIDDIKDLDESIEGTLKYIIEGKIKFKNDSDFIYSVEAKVVENNDVEKIIFDVFQELNSRNFIRVIQSKHKEKQIFIFKEYVDLALISKNYLVLKVDKDGDYSADLIVVDENSNLMAKYEISKDFEDNEIEIEYLILLNGRIEEGEIEINIIKVGDQYQYNYKTKNDKGTSEHKGRRFRFNKDSPPGKGPVSFIGI